MNRLDIDWDTAAFERGLRDALDDLKDDVERDVRGFASSAEAAASSAAPVLTGELRASIESEVHREGREIVGEVGTDDPKAIFQEFGTSRHRPQPFLRPAIAAAVAAHLGG